MSETRIYTVDDLGDLETLATYRNSYGSAFAVWDALSVKYVPGVSRSRVATVWPGGGIIKKRHPTDRDVVRELWALGNSGERLEDFERLTLWTTYDNVIARPGHIEAYAMAMRQFAEVYGPGFDSRGVVFSIGEQARDLIEFCESDDPWPRGVCWDQIGDGWSGAWNEKRRVAALREVLGPIIAEPALTQTVAALDDWMPDDPHCEYNIDLDTGHKWLPAPDVRVWPDG